MAMWKLIVVIIVVGFLSSYVTGVVNVKEVEVAA